MPLSWNEIRNNAIGFSKRWEDEASEDAEAKTFWDEFFQVFGVNRRRLATFERNVALPGGRHGFIDLFWKGTILVEHKSRGKDLNRAYEQAKGYFPGLRDEELPKYILTSDFDRFCLYNLETDERHDFTLKELPHKVRLFGFMIGYRSGPIVPEDPINVKAAEKMARIHDQLKASGYKGHELEVYLVRLLFCLFADDTGIFEKNQFIDYLSQRTTEDGSDLGDRLAGLFDVLNTSPEGRQKNLDEQLAGFRYVNGGLFSERLRTAAFDRKLRDAMLESAALDWSGISPAIFGSLFQGVMDPKERRNLGAHYTSEKNILKLIGPLFLDDLRDEFEKARKTNKALTDFHKKLAGLKFLDPACGCGNFLVVTYRELRLLELEVLKELFSKELKAGQRVLDVGLMVRVNVSQFYGIEIEEFPARIAETALWLTDHQMNNLVSDVFGETYVRLPLTTPPNIHHGNALRLDWGMVAPRAELSYILGNPPFIGSKLMSDAQRLEMATLAEGAGAGNLDYVAGWYLKAAKFIDGSKISVGFVSTNSICQGEQASTLWSLLRHQYGLRTHFAHQTFQWRNEGRGVAAVFCVIVGFAKFEPANRKLYSYDDLKGEPHESIVGKINPYLVDAPDVFLSSRRVPICDIPEICFGSMPNDGGHLLMTDEEYSRLIKDEPEAKKFIRPFMGAQEFINGEKRWCIWLSGVPLKDFSSIKTVMSKVKSVRDYRKKSTRAATNKLAETPSLFGEIRHVDHEYLLVPRHSSERRNIIPIGYLSGKVIAGDSCLIVPKAKPYHFGVLTSRMHMSWVRYVCGRLKSDYRYSNSVVYNNFPWPESPSAAKVALVEEAASEILAVRKRYPTDTYADLYDPLLTPKDLLKAHAALDKAVDAAYGKKGFANESERVSFLFDLYLKYTAPFAAAADGGTLKSKKVKRLIP